MMWKNRSIHDRRESRNASLRLQKLLPRNLLDIGDASLRNFELRKQLFRVLCGRFACGESQCRAALHCRAIEQALRRWSSKHGRGLRSTARLAEDHDAARIAAEVFNVLSHPLKRRHQIHDSNYAGIGEF